ncbi:MAG: ATP-grasp domain-containing protein [Gemmatimonadales bacterium]
MGDQPHVLLAGVTTRALAVSASRAGYRVTAIDAYGDLDLRAVAQVIGIHGNRGYSALAAAGAARASGAGAVAYTSNFENYPEAIGVLAAGRRLLGNPGPVVARVRDPLELARTLRRAGFAAPAVRGSPPTGRQRPGAWLLKPRRSGGGHGTRVWRQGQAVPRTSYLQERIRGASGSIVFLADGCRVTPLGISRQLIGEAIFGAQGFRYCGSIMGSPRRPVFEQQAELQERAQALACFIADQFGLVGLNCIDFIAHAGVPYPIEVNPRYSASMELVERSSGTPLFALHAEACQGRLPTRPPAGDPDRTFGKAVVFARRGVSAGDTRGWLGRPLGDVPHPGEQIPRGRPICTVFAEGRGPASCRRSLVARAAWVYRAVELRARGAA